MSNNLERLAALRHTHWVQNIPSSTDRITHLFFEGIGTYDVDRPLFEAVRKGVYFLEFPHLNRTESSIPSTYTKVVADARSKGLVIGFSGYATGGEGYDYEAELQAVETIFTTLQTEVPHSISLAIHGGTREGIPVIVNLVALEHNTQSMGILPVRGLDWLPDPGLDYLVVKGINWGDESEVLGSTPDILFLFGGGNNALKDAEAALANKRKLVAVRLKEYPKTSAVNKISKDMFTAEINSNDQLVSFLKSFHINS